MSFNLIKNLCGSFCAQCCFCVRLRDMKFFVIFLCFFFVLSGQVVVGNDDDDEPTCDELKQDMDNAAKKVFFISNPNIRPFKSPQDFKKKYCNPFLSKSDGGWIKIMSRYRRCKRSFQRTVYG